MVAETAVLIPKVLNRLRDLGPSEVSEIGELQVTSNALLESQLLHVRQLTNFLIGTSERTRDDDVLRTDFTTEWEPRPQSAVRELSGLIVPLNKHLAHLTRDRTKSRVPKWYYEDIAQDVVLVATEWCSHLERSMGLEFAKPLSELLLRSRQMLGLQAATVFR